MIPIRIPIGAVWILIKYAYALAYLVIELWTLRIPREMVSMAKTLLIQGSTIKDEGTHGKWVPVDMDAVKPMDTSKPAPPTPKELQEHIKEAQKDKSKNILPESWQNKH